MGNKSYKSLLIDGSILLILMIIMMVDHKSLVTYHCYFILKGIYLIGSLIVFVHLLDLKIKYLNIGWGFLTILAFQLFIDEFTSISISNKKDMMMKDVLLSMGMILMVYGFYHYIKEKEKVLDKLHDLAFCDSLTNIPNRRFMEEQLKAVITKEQKKVSLLFIDLDQFKSINDAFGHRIGDELLTQVASRLKGILREKDIVARLGGDEFMIAAYDIKDIEEVENIVQRVLGLFKQAFILKEEPFYITCSCGVAIYPDHGTDVQLLFQKADEAMYQAKKEGYNRYIIYDSYINKNNVIELGKSRREAFQRKNFYSIHHH